MNHPSDFAVSCPIPLQKYPNVTLAHGGGGKLTHDLIEKIFIPAFGNQTPGGLHDSAVLEVKSGRLAFTTDSFVVRPLIFPGGDIGALAVNGTVNDLAMSGARPLYISAGFIIEEGLPMETLWRIVQSMARAAREAGVKLVTGDTKVVEKGKADGLFINTSGVGAIDHAFSIHPNSVRENDAIIVNGDIARHGIEIMSVRENLSFESEIESDCAPLWRPVEALLKAGIEIRCLRDLTRGGLATSMVEIAKSAGLNVHLDENAIPVREDVRGACEIMGFDPMYVANEGRFALFVPADQADCALKILGESARRIGTVRRDNPGTVTLKNRIGSVRIVDMLSGEQLPRIC